jgi:hypothetical protein
MLYESHSIPPSQKTLRMRYKLQDMMLTSYGAEHYSIGHQLCSHSMFSRSFMEAESLLPHSQELSTCTYAIQSTSP